MRSALYTGHTIHIRSRPTKHAFKYRYFQFFIDFDEIDEVIKKIFFISKNKFNVYSLWDRDHALKGKDTIKEAITSTVLKEHPEFKIEKVSLLTSLRTFGHIFNPVCYYLVQNETKQSVIVAEVMNTFFEQKTFVSEIIDEKDDVVYLKQRFNKDFYISPYSSSLGEMDYEYSFKEGEEIKIKVRNFENNIQNVYADLILKKVELTNFNIFLSIFQYPLMTLMTVFGIHFQALRLFLKGVRFYGKNEEKNHQRGFELWKNQLKRMK